MHEFDSFEVRSRLIRYEQNCNCQHNFISNRAQEPEPKPTLTSTKNQAVDKIASFAIFTNGTFRIFTASMYHNLSPDVYIEQSNPNIVKIKKDKITWDDFFKTLPFKLTADCLTTGTKETFCTGSNGTLKFYLNGERNENALNQEIKDGDEILVSYGNESDDAIKKQLDTFSIKMNY